MKTWLKGGLVGLIISIIIIFVLILGGFFTKGGDSNLDLFGKIIRAPLDFLFPCVGESCLNRLFLIPLEVILIPILLGAFIGWLIGKFKN